MPLPQSKLATREFDISEFESLGGNSACLATSHVDLGPMLERLAGHDAGRVGARERQLARIVLTYSISSLTVFAVTYDICTRAI